MLTYANVSLELEDGVLDDSIGVLTTAFYIHTASRMGRGLVDIKKSRCLWRLRHDRRLTDLMPEVWRSISYLKTIRYVLRRDGISGLINESIGPSCVQKHLLILNSFLDLLDTVGVIKELKEYKLT